MHWTYLNICARLDLIMRYCEVSRTDELNRQKCIQTLEYMKRMVENMESAPGSTKEALGHSSVVEKHSMLSIYS